MDDEQKKFLEESGFDHGVAMSLLHQDCPEYQTLLEELEALMVQLQQKMFEHHQNCSKR